MSTILFNEIVFGPIKSRRLGNSLGINLLPQYGKWCSFDCIYCECGWNKDGKKDNTLPSLEIVKQALSEKLNKHKEDGTAIDTITFSGNGEPTLHPNFKEIIEYTLHLRGLLFPNAKVSVLTNASQLERVSVVEALKLIDNPILKIDSALEEYVNIIDRPSKSYSLKKTIENIKQFNGNFILQTMFLKGKQDGKEIDSCNLENVARWLELVRQLKPREIMMYTIDRQTPNSTLQKIKVKQMEEIAAPLIKDGYKVQIKG